MSSKPHTVQQKDATDAIDDLEGTGLLSRRQAEAFVYREISRLDRHEAADRMGVKVTTVDHHHQAAKKNIRQATEGLDLIEELENSRPSHCEECGDELGSQWATTDDGRALCFACAQSDG